MDEQALRAELARVRAELRDTKDALELMRAARDKEAWWRDQLREEWRHAREQESKARKDYNELLRKLIQRL